VGGDLATQLLIEQTNLASMLAGGAWLVFRAHRTARRYCGRLYAGSQGAVMERLDEAQRQAQAHLPGFVDYPSNAVLMHDAALYPCDPETPSRRAVMKHARPQLHGAVSRFSLPVHELAVS
jgi:hypothetical protein